MNFAQGIRGRVVDGFLGSHYLKAFESPRDLVPHWGTERLYHPIRHNRDTLARRTHLANHYDRNACSLIL